jgi:hypothetical protein
VKEEEVIYRELNKYNIDNSLDNMISLLLHEDYYRTDKKRDMHFAIGSIDLTKGDFISKIIEDDSYILTSFGIMTTGYKTS